MLQHMVSRNMPPKNCVVDFGLQRQSPVNLGVIIIPGRFRSDVQSFPSKSISVCSEIDATSIIQS